MKNLIALAYENPVFAGVLTFSGVMLIIGLVKAFNRSNETVPEEPVNPNPEPVPNPRSGAELILQTARVMTPSRSMAPNNGGMRGARVSSVKS